MIGKIILFSPLDLSVGVLLRSVASPFLLDSLAIAKVLFRLRGEKKPTRKPVSIDFWVERQIICNRNYFWIKLISFESSTDSRPYNKGTMNTYYQNGKGSSKYVQRNKRLQYQAFKIDQVFRAHELLAVLLKTSYRQLIFSTCQSSHTHPLKMTKHNTDFI